MTTTGSYDKHASHRSVDAEIQRLAAQARTGWDKEARMLAWLGLKDGMALLEAGSGPGFITAQLLELLPSSQLTCLEIDPAMLAQAAQYLGDKGGRVRFVEGSAMDTGLEANQFDAVYARFLFQHLADPAGAASEMLRVLKPGGRLIIHDIDDELFGVFEPPIPELAVVVEKFGQAQAARGGNRHIGRQLWRLLGAAGFHNIDIEVLAAHSGSRGVESFLLHIDPDRMQPLVSMGLLSAQQLEQYRAARTRFMESPEPFTLWLSLLVCGEKPAADQPA